MNQFDSVLLSQVRLSVISVLMQRGEATFSDLRALLKLTQGNLGSHLQNLEKAGYVEIEKSFVDKKPQTTARITDTGRSAFLRHVEELAKIASHDAEHNGQSR